MTFQQSTGLRDREYDKFVQDSAGSRSLVATAPTIQKYVFTPTALVSAAGNLTAYSNVPLNGEIKRITVDIGNWTATGSLWIKESGTNIQPEILQHISGTQAFGSYRPIYPAEYPSYTVSGTAGHTAIGVGSPQTMFPIIVTENIVIQASGLGTGKSGLGIIVEFR